jgi:hypothetical protein
MWCSNFELTHTTNTNLDTLAGPLTECIHDVYIPGFGTHAALPAFSWVYVAPI